MAALALVMPAAAQAANERLELYQEPDGTARIHGEPGGPSGPERLDVLRLGAPIGTPLQMTDWGMATQLSQLLIGDEARYFVNGRHVITHVYDGFPAISGACAGATAFGVGLGPLEVVSMVTGSVGSANPTRPSMTEPGVFEVARPLAIGDVIAVNAFRTVDGVRVTQGRRVHVVDCSPPVPAPPPAPPIVAQAAIPSLQEALVTAVRSARRTSRGVTLTVSFPQPGTLKLRLSGKGRTLTTVRRAGANTETIPLRIVRGQRNRTLTLTATLSPVKAGAPQTAKVTLKR